MDFDYNPLSESTEPSRVTYVAIDARNNGYVRLSRLGRLLRISFTASACRLIDLIFQKRSIDRAELKTFLVNSTEVFEL